MAGLVIFPQGSGKIPLVSTSNGDRALAGLAAGASKIYIFELFAAVATIFALRRRLVGKRIILFVGNEAACAALTGGTATNRCAPLLAYTTWPGVAQFDLKIWTERVPSARNPADLPSRNKELRFATEAVQELPNFSQMTKFCDLSGLLQK